MTRETRLPNELSSSELKEKIKLGEAAGSDILHFEVDLHVKFAFHFASFVVSLIGLKFGYKSERSMESAKSILLAVILGVSYWFILNAGRAMGKQGGLPPIVAAWSANVIIFAFAWYSIIRSSRS
jgi:lipopolysaccharide export system permease protein